MKLTQADAAALFLPLIQGDGSTYAKYQKVLARPAVVGEKVVTITSSGKETENTAKEGDFVVQAQTEAGECYILSGSKLVSRYKIGPSIWQRATPGDSQTDVVEWKEYTPTGTVQAVEYQPHVVGLLNQMRTVPNDKFLATDPEIITHFIAIWNEEMVCNKGDMICTPDGKEVYRIDRVEFEQTYKIKR